MLRFYALLFCFFLKNFANTEKNINFAEKNIMLNFISEKKLCELRKILEKHKVKRAYLFGSILTEHFNENSDIDFLISFQDGLEPLYNGELWWSLYDELRLMFNREIDIITERTLKNPYFIKELNETKQLIYGESN